MVKLVFKPFNRNTFTINKNHEENLSYLLHTETPHIYIEKDVLKTLYKYTFEFLVKNYKNKENILNVYSLDKNINDYITIINECISAVYVSNLPPNTATPEYMAKYINKVFKNNKDVKVKTFDLQRIKKEHLNLLDAVGDGNYNKPYFVIVERLIPNKQITCIIGKGITFDSGGVSIKSGITYHLDYMKLDKLGACYGIHLCKYIIENTDCSIVGIFPLTDNILSAKTLKPGDVIKSHSKKTVEISNTDAEGRLIVADSLSYSSKYNPTNIIDITTFTSTHISCDDYGVFFTENKKTKNMIEEMSIKLKEPIIGLPTYINSTHLKSSVADIKNSSKVCSSSYNAAMFLHEFVPKECNWIHFDISNEIYTTDEQLIPNGKGFLTILNTIKKLNNIY